jgi:hypothetical protein
MKLSKFDKHLIAWIAFLVIGVTVYLTVIGYVVIHFVRKFW